MRFFAIKSMFRHFFGGAFIALSFFSAFVSPAYAQADAGAYKALPISISGGGTLTMKPGEVKEVTVTVQNAGAKTWMNDGSGYISLYTYTPKYRTSVFDPGTWLSPSQVKRIRESSVAPGKTASLVFQLRAPSTTGSYTEGFKLASEDIAWVENGDIVFNIVVSNTTPSSSPSSSSSASSSATTTSSTDGYAASLTVQAATKVKAVAGKSILFSVIFKNTGTKTWTKYGLVVPDVSTASTSTLSFSNSSWKGNQVALESGTVKPGESATIAFSFSAPKTNGTHTAKFQLSANDVEVPDAMISIPVEVTGGAADAGRDREETDPSAIEQKDLISEPTMRVGVLIVDEETDNEVVVTSNESAFSLTDINGKTLGTLEKGEEVTAYYQDGSYYYKIDGKKKSSALALRFVPDTKNAVMTVTNFDRRETRGAANADNTFRNVLEIRYNDYKDRTWLINELPMEYYLKGLAETSNSSPLEFQKALLTAARTYGFYHFSRGDATASSKHSKEYFHVDAYADQVYNGYGQEARTPNLSKGVDDSRGVIVTYQGETAITPYFSRSDGRTRSWSEVWYGDVPWAVSVPVPCDEGKTLWGHGVGMSASGALCMANDGKDWKTILKYFYTGVDLTQRWK